MNASFHRNSGDSRPLPASLRPRENYIHYVSQKEHCDKERLIDLVFHDAALFFGQNVCVNDLVNDEAGQFHGEPLSPCVR